MSAWWQQLVLVMLGASYVMIGRLVMRKTKQGQQAVERHYHNVFSHVTDAVGNVAVLQSYNRIAHETEALRNHVAAGMRAAQLAGNEEVEVWRTWPAPMNGRWSLILSNA